MNIWIIYTLKLKEIKTRICIYLNEYLYLNNWETLNYCVRNGHGKLMSGIKYVVNECWMYFFLSLRVPVNDTVIKGEH